MVKLLWLHRQIMEQFQLAEVQSMAVLFKTTIEIVEWNENTPFMYVEIGSLEAAKQMAKRATLCRALLEPWGIGKTHEECCQDAKTSIPEDKKKTTPQRRFILQMSC